MNQLKPYDNTSDIALSVGEGQFVKECRLACLAVNTDGLSDGFPAELNWFETATLALIKDAEKRIFDTITWSRLLGLLEIGFTWTETFTERETGLVQKLVIDMREFPVGTWVKTVLRSNISLSEQAHCAFIERARSPAGMMFVIANRATELTPELFYEIIAELAYDKLFRAPDCDRLPVGVTSLHLVDFMVKKHGFLRAFRVEWGRKANPEWFDEQVIMWGKVIRAAVNEARSTLNVGSNVPDEWVIQTGFEYPEETMEFRRLVWGLSDRYSLKV